MRLRFVYEMISYLLRKYSASMKKYDRNTGEIFLASYESKSGSTSGNDMDFFDGIFCGLYKQGSSLQCAGSICIQCGT